MRQNKIKRHEYVVELKAIKVYFSTFLLFQNHDLHEFLKIKSSLQQK